MSLFIKCDVTRDRSYSEEFALTPSHHTAYAKQVPFYSLKSDQKESFFISWFYVSKKSDIIREIYAKQEKTQQGTTV